MTLTLRTLALSLSLLLIPMAHADTFRFYGYAFDLKSGAYLYTEVHEQTIEQEAWTGGRIRYYNDQGDLIGDKPLRFTEDPYIPLYELSLPYKDYVEGIRAVGDDVVMFKGSGGTRKEKSVRRRDLMAADSGFHSLLRDNFDALLKGETVRFRLIVAGNLDSFGFRARKVGDTTFDGEAAIKLMVEPDSLLRLLVDPLELVYEPRERRLLEYRGISNIHDPTTGEAYNVRIVYPRTPPAGAPARLPPLEGEGT